MWSSPQSEVRRKAVQQVDSHIGEEMRFQGLETVHHAFLSTWNAYKNVRQLRSENHERVGSSQVGEYQRVVSGGERRNAYST